MRWKLLQLSSDRSQELKEVTLEMLHHRRQFVCGGSRDRGSEVGRKKLEADSVTVEAALMVMEAVVVIWVDFASAVAGL